jgi:hypothetical protein
LCQEKKYLVEYFKPVDFSPIVEEFCSKVVATNHTAIFFVNLNVFFSHLTMLTDISLLCIFQSFFAQQQGIKVRDVFRNLDDFIYKPLD